MKRPTFWIGLCFAVATAAGLAYVGLIYVLLNAQVSISENFDKDEVAYSAEKTLDGFDFQVTLFRNHPRFAEYRKVLKVKQGEKVILEREFSDTGGLATFYFLRQGNRI